MNRRSFLAGLIAAPAIIKTPGLLMPIKPPIRGWFITDVISSNIYLRGDGLWLELRPGDSKSFRMRNGYDVFVRHEGLNLVS